MQGSFRFVNKVYEYFKNFEPGKSSSRIESKLNKTIKNVTEYTENFKHNLSVIEIRDLFNNFIEDKIDKKTAGVFLKILHPFCPHITEELWEKIGNKGFISIEKWPKVDESKIDEKLEKQEEFVKKLIIDINHIVKLVKAKPKKAIVYVLPNEKDLYLEYFDLIEKKINLDLEIYATNDKNKYDPENKSKKVKPGRPGIYLE
jgi:leucyl-tRNA synthetase